MLKSMTNLEFWKQNLVPSFILKKIFHSIYLVIQPLFDLEDYLFNLELTWKTPKRFSLLQSGNPVS